ncbi:uncharacterized protein B0H18DRAFT_968470 [Fomitopsis serialis]|uniref:uncharacterized protein n=1 Tax=Fomitopsis serialis TaxID=139415 RepID=UPI002007B42A|nr:uncharacterized protein B0H18DRAFT_968470 [Neoantrodia serialis]KAH9938729.1 hypothetical protein B0H18DRAFT_968470 [Neoantrodia serialis]
MSAVGDKEPVERIRERIDLEIAQLRDSVQVLVARRNELAPVLRLPVELLSEIFVLNVATHSPEDLRWTQVAYVCQYWRSVALQTPRLWTCINFKTEPWVALQLERSKTMPLVAHVDLRARQFASKCEGFGLLARSMGRVRQLSISSGEMRGTVHKLWRHMTYPAPLLESFVFHNPSQSRAGPTSHVPTQLFRGECPSLKYVELRQCTWCWATTLFTHTVTHLTLDGATSKCRLELMPNLEWLDLDHITPEVPWFFIPNVDVGQFVHLPCLKFLRIDALALNCAILLYHISFPMDTQLVLYCDAFRRLDEFMAVGHAIAVKHRRGEAMGIQDLRLKSFTFVPHDQALELFTWREAYSADELYDAARKRRCDAAVRVLLRWDGREPDFSVASLLVRAFYIPEYVSLTGQAWIELFSGMKSVSSVWVQGRSATHLPDALRRENCSQCRADITGEMLAGDPLRQHTRVPSLFPLLHTLILEEVDFTGDTCPDACFFWQLQDVVLERSKHAGKLKLIVHRCRNFIVEQMQDLRMVGADVTWNGEEILDFDLRDVDSDDSEEDYEDFYDRPYSEDDSDDE